MVSWKGRKGKMRKLRVILILMLYEYHHFFLNEIRIFDKSIRIENLWTASATMFIERGRDRKDKKEEVEKERN